MGMMPRTTPDENRLDPASRETLVRGVGAWRRTIAVVVVLLVIGGAALVAGSSLPPQEEGVPMYVDSNAVVA